MSAPRITLQGARKTLLLAGRQYSQCAKLVEAKSTKKSTLSSVDMAQLVGLGVASDWTRRAACMDDITFVGKIMNASSRTPGFVELMRFNFAWSGMNAIFGRDELLSLITKPVQHELPRFRSVYNASKLDPATVTTRLIVVHDILSTKIRPRLPGLPAGTEVSTLQAIASRHFPAGILSTGIAKAISEAIKSQNLAPLDLPLLIYALRNWSVHGNTLDSSFRGLPKFRAYVDTLLETIADVHLAASGIILQKL
jgi:hypothetical protein